jgi:hypothetical protein
MKKSKPAVLVLSTLLLIGLSYIGYQKIFKYIIDVKLTVLNCKLDGKKPITFDILFDEHKKLVYLKDRTSTIKTDEKDVQFTETTIKFSQNRDYVSGNDKQPIILFYEVDRASYKVSRSIKVLLTGDSTKPSMGVCVIGKEK